MIHYKNLKMEKLMVLEQLIFYWSRSTLQARALYHAHDVRLPQCDLNLDIRSYNTLNSDMFVLMLFSLMNYIARAWSVERLQ